MKFDSEYIELLPLEPLAAGRKFCSDFAHFHNEVMTNDLQLADPIYNNYLSALGLAQELSQSNGLLIDFPPIEKDRTYTISHIATFVSSLRGDLDLRFAELVVSQTKDSLSNKFGKNFHYEFSPGDAARAQELINELRNLVTMSEVFEEGHRTRLLARLEKLQSELHKRITNLDAFWGLIGDAGVALGKFGADAKPLFERIRELTLLVWATQSRGEGLPSTCPPPISLPSPSTPAEHQFESTPSIDV